MRVAVVGAGLGGLSAAAHLVSDGHDVVVYERGSVPGGLAASERHGDFRLDLGPTVITMPELIGQPFAALGTELGDAVELTRLDPIYRAVFADRSELRVRAGRDEMRAEVAAFAGPHAGQQFDRFVSWLDDLYRVEMPNFIDTNFDGPLDLARRWRSLSRLASLGAFQRLDQAVGSYLTDPRLRRVFSFQSLYAGVAPQRALALYAVITYLDTVAGVWGVEGGASAIADSLARLLTTHGARTEFDTPVTRIVRRDDGSVGGVELAGELRVEYDAVVVNADVGGSYRSLLDVRPPLRTIRNRYSPSCLVWSAGVRGVPEPDVASHNVHFGHAWDDAFAALDDGVRMPDPSMLVSVPSLHDPTAAPVGSTSMFVLEPVPNLGGRVDWASGRERFGQELRDRAGRWGYPVDEVVAERVTDPLAWRATGLAHGTPFSLAHTFRQTGPLRPANADRRIPGLAFVGAGTTPGVGVPMVMLSGKLAAARLSAHAAETRTVRW
jgi:phytoene desaturase